jgi:hypothetical protein
MLTLITELKNLRLLNERRAIAAFPHDYQAKNMQVF